MFKNLLVYRLAPEWQPDAVAAEAALASQRFTECAATQAVSAGWVEPRGVAHGPLIEIIGGQWLLKLAVETRMLPGAVVRRRAQALAQQIEQDSGRKPGKKLMRDLMDQATQELLPQAFTKQAAVRVWIDPKARTLMVDVSSAKRAEEVVTLLVKALPGFAVKALQTGLSPAKAMADWLASGEPPAPFTVDRECELKAPDELKATVRYTRHHLDIDEVREHIKAGKQPTKLALTWHGRVSFVLTEALQIKRIAFDDVVFESSKAAQTSADEAFDADAAIATGELSRLIPDLIDALDGELTPDAEAAAPAPADTAADDSPPWA